jgi:hypothetical protein
MRKFEAQQIREIVARRRPELVWLADQLGTYSLTSDEREDLRGVIAEELLEVGLDEQDQPTPKGLALERLIDLIGHG